MKNQGLIWMLIILFLAGAWWLYDDLDKRKLPELSRTEIMMNINWNERIHVEESKTRVVRLMKQTRGPEYFMAMVGKQQFLLGNRKDATSSEVSIFIKASSPKRLDDIISDLQRKMHKEFRYATVSFEVAESIFDLVFSDDQPPLLARLMPVNPGNPGNNRYLAGLIGHIEEALPDAPMDPPSWEEQIVLSVEADKLLTYNVSFEAVYDKLRSAFNENEILTLNENQEMIPVIIGGKSRRLHEILNTLNVQNHEGILIPIRTLFDESRSFDLKTIRAGKEGEYFPLRLNIKPGEAGRVMEIIKNVVKTDPAFDVSFTGTVFSNRKLIMELFVILVISLMLLYFILASQFESLTLPLIVLVEVPIDIFGAFLMLKVFGSSINLMSMIGIVVMSGIIINDSILKIDTINRLYNTGTPLLKSLIVAGKRRLKPIIMTSATTILALVPFLFYHGLGADLQRPLALAIIGGMTIGTLVSLYFVPLLYFWLKRTTGGNRADESNI